MLSKIIVDEIRQARSRQAKVAAEHDSPLSQPQISDDPKTLQQYYHSLQEEIRKLDQENEKLKKECFRLHLKLERLLHRL